MIWLCGPFCLLLLCWRLSRSKEHTALYDLTATAVNVTTRITAASATTLANCYSLKIGPVKLSWLIHSSITSDVRRTVTMRLTFEWGVLERTSDDDTRSLLMRSGCFFNDRHYTRRSSIQSTSPGSANIDSTILHYQHRQLPARRTGQK